MFYYRIYYIYIFFFFKEENRDRQKPKQNLCITLQHYLQQPRYGSNSKHPLTDEWIKIWSIYTIEYYSAIKKEWNNAICSNMYRPRDDHTKWSQTKTNIIWPLTGVSKIWHRWNTDKTETDLEAMKTLCWPSASSNFQSIWVHREQSPGKRKTTEKGL